MAGWRHELRSWAAETPHRVDDASLPAWMRDSTETDRQQRELLRALLAALALSFGFPLAIALLAMSFLMGQDSAWAPAVGGFGVVWACVSLIRGVKRVSERWYARRERRLTDWLESRGETTLGGEFVGATYTKELWRHPQLGDDMDSGFLRIEFDRLVFVGRHTRFELPSRSIASTEIRKLDGPFGTTRPRLYLHWSDGLQGGTLSVCFPFRRSLRQRVKEMIELRDRIESWRVEPYPQRSSSSPTLPPTIP